MQQQTSKVLQTHLEPYLEHYTQKKRIKERDTEIKQTLITTDSRIGMKSLILESIRHFEI